MIQAFFRKEQIILDSNWIFFPSVHIFDIKKLMFNKISGQNISKYCTSHIIIPYNQDTIFTNINIYTSSLYVKIVMTVKVTILFHIISRY